MFHVKRRPAKGARWSAGRRSPGAGRRSSIAGHTTGPTAAHPPASPFHVKPQSRIAAAASKPQPRQVVGDGRVFNAAKGGTPSRFRETRQLPSRGGGLGTTREGSPSGTIYMSRPDTARIPRAGSTSLASVIQQCRHDGPALAPRRRLVEPLRRRPPAASGSAQHRTTSCTPRHRWANGPRARPPETPSPLALLASDHDGAEADESLAAMALRPSITPWTPRTGLCDGRTTGGWILWAASSHAPSPAVSRETSTAGGEPTAPDVNTHSTTSCHRPHRRSPPAGPSADTRRRRPRTAALTQRTRRHTQLNDNPVNRPGTARPLRTDVSRETPVPPVIPQKSARQQRTVPEPAARGVSRQALATSRGRAAIHWRSVVVRGPASRAHRARFARTVPLPPPGSARCARPPRRTARGRQAHEVGRGIVR
jgi:hypothetical protein